MDVHTLSKIDAHTHVFYDRAFLTDLLDRWRLKLLVINITGEDLFDEPMEERWAAMTALKEQYPDRVRLCTTFDPAGVVEEGFTDRVIDALAEDVRRGASVVKVWKDLGLEVRDRDGQYVQVDDPRFQPIWDFLAETDVPVIAHIGEPRAAWQPLDPESPHYRFYSEHPKYHLHDREDVPPWRALMEARDRWLEQNPELTVVGAHFGSMAYDVEEVAQRLDRYDNFYVDTAERFGDLVTQSSEAVRDFFLAYSDRILYGTDVIVEHDAEHISAEHEADERANYEELLSSHWHYLSGDGAITIQDKLVEPVTVEALNLPSDVLRAVYHDNAASLYGFS